MRRALVALALTLAVPSSASAAPFNELPFQPVSGGAACLRPTGAPGELVRWYSGGAEILTAQPTGLVAQARVPLGRRIACPVVASDPNGAAVMATAALNRVRVAVREPGGSWGPPVTFPARDYADVEVAVSARGDAVVVWTEDLMPLQGRVRVARRAPGGGFGPPQTLRPASRAAAFTTIRAGMDGGGNALVLFTTDGTRGRSTVNVVSASPGGPFGAPRKLGAGSIDDPALAVAADGRALVTANGYNGLEVYERPPGGAFGPPTIPFEASAQNVAIALRSGGAAAIAWQNSVGEDVYAVVRGGATPFGMWTQVLKPPPPKAGRSGFGAGAIVLDGGPPPEASEALRVTLGADGRALLMWATDDRGLGTATVTSAGRTEIGTLGSPLRSPLGPSPLLFADGTRALAWTDDRPYLAVGPWAGRLHLALEGAAVQPAGPAPTIKVGAPRRSELRPAQPLIVPVRCSAACDLRASLPGWDDNFITASLTRAGTAELRFDPLGEAIAPERPGSIPITLQSGAPGAAIAQRQTVRVRLRRLPPPPLPQFLDVRVRRRGDDLVVRWRTDVPMRDGYLFAYATRTRDPEKDRNPAVGFVTGDGPSFRVVLRDAARKRFLHLAAVQPVGDRTRSKTIRLSFTAS